MEFGYKLTLILYIMSNQDYPKIVMASFVGPIVKDLFYLYCKIPDFLNVGGILNLGKIDAHFLYHVKSRLCYILLRSARINNHLVWVLQYRVQKPHILHLQNILCSK